MLPVKNLLALALDRFPRRCGASLKEAGGVISFVEDERRFSRRPRGTSPLFEPTLKLLQHLRKLFCIVAVAFINVVKQWQGFIGRAEQRIADLPKIGPPLLVLAPFGQFALKIESVDEGVEVGAVITDL